MKTGIVTGTLAALALVGCSQQAADAPLDGAWTLDGARSSVSFVTVKGGQVAEVHHFGGLAGSVAANGAATVTIDLASVETNVDVRNQRMRDVLFQTAEFPEAQITAAFDPAQVATLALGEAVTLPVETTLSLHGASGAVPAELVVTRIDADKVKVETARPVVVAAGAFGLSPGLAELANLASLTAITEQVPVSASLVFTREGAGER